MLICREEYSVELAYVHDSIKALLSQIKNAFNLFENG
jgi:hypothetical protein